MDAVRHKHQQEEESEPDRGVIKRRVAAAKANRL